MSAAASRGLLSSEIMAMSALANDFIAGLVLVLVQTLGLYAYAAGGVPFLTDALMAEGLRCHCAVHVKDSPLTAAAGTITAVSLLQVVTVSAYGPVGAYLAERFSTGVRASGYDVGDALSIVAPALYPFWLPGLLAQLGQVAAVGVVLAAASALLIIGAALGPEPARDEPLG